MARDRCLPAELDFRNTFSDCGTGCPSEHGGREKAGHHGGENDKRNWPIEHPAIRPVCGQRDKRGLGLGMETVFHGGGLPGRAAGGGDGLGWGDPAECSRLREACLSGRKGIAVNSDVLKCPPTETKP